MTDVWKYFYKFICFFEFKKIKVLLVIAFRNMSPSIKIIFFFICLQRDDFWWCINNLLLLLFCILLLLASGFNKDIIKFWCHNVKCSSEWIINFQFCWSGCWALEEFQWRNFSQEFKAINQPSYTPLSINFHKSIKLNSLADPIISKSIKYSN